MNSEKRNKIFYWILTILVLLPTAGSGIPELFISASPSTLQTIHALGYPLYIVKILGLAKILGAIAILTSRFPKLTEWAYAGFTFLFLGATASHLLAGDTAHAPIPIVFFVILMGSYFLGKKSTEQALVSSSIVPETQQRRPQGVKAS